MTRGQTIKNKTVYGTQAWTFRSGKTGGHAYSCIWMQSGAVGKKDCNNYYDCSSCRYNAAMEKLVDQGRQVSWQDSTRFKNGYCGPCRHNLTGRFGAKVCPFNYRCSHCHFDQFFEDVLTLQTPVAPHTVNNVKGFDVPEGYYFHSGHTWARIENGGCIRIGIDDFALKVLGEPDGLDLPLMGKELHAGKPGWGLNRQGNSADVLSPVTGIIVAVNHGARKTPAVAGRAPYSDGWLFSVRTNDIRESFKTLMVDKDSISWMDHEVSALENMIEEVAGPLAADGGYLQADVFGNLPSLGWRNLTKRFLRS